jgi:predicted XRE-type DNA-binding protein
MSKAQSFANVWDALEDDPVRAENLRLRSALLIQVTQKIKSMGITQQQAASLLQISQPRVCALLQGKIEQFRLDSLVDMAHRLGLSVQISIAA